MEKKAYYFCISIVILIVAAISNQLLLITINSDALYVFELAENVVRGIILSGQNVPAAPYFFPDAAFIALLHLITHNISLLHYIHAVVFLSAFCFLVYQLINLSLENRFYARLGSLIASVAVFLVIVPQFYFLQDFLGAHLSIVIYSIGFLWFYLKNRHKPLPIPYCFCIFVLTFLIFISDNLLFPQLLFPLFILIVIDLFCKKINKSFAYRILILFLFATVLGAKIEFFLNYFFDITISNNVSLFRIRKIKELDKTIVLAIQIFSSSIRENPYGFIIILFNHFVTIVLGCFLYAHKKQFKLNTLFDILIFLYIVQISNLILAVLVGKITAPPHLRYLDPLFIFPAVSAALVMMHVLMATSFKKIMNVLIFLVILGSEVFFVRQYREIHADIFSKPYTGLNQCLDMLSKKYNLTHGLAEYWNVRLFRMLSKENVKISQINNQLQFFNFTDNKSFFYTDSTKKSHPNYQFIIVNQLPKESIIANVGQPGRIEYCSNYEIWLYVDKVRNARMNQYFNDMQFQA